jgi:hypothetical protein
MWVLSVTGLKVSRGAEEEEWSATTTTFKVYDWSSTTCCVCRSIKLQLQTTQGWHLWCIILSYLWVYKFISSHIRTCNMFLLDLYSHTCTKVFKLAVGPRLMSFMLPCCCTIRPLYEQGVIVSICRGFIASGFVVVLSPEFTVLLQNIVSAISFAAHIFFYYYYGFVTLCKVRIARGGVNSLFKNLQATLNNHVSIKDG